MSYETFMARALHLAVRGLYTTAPNPRVGCVIVKGDNIIAEGWHQRAGQPHAEINALAQLEYQQAQGADCYITLEPCSHAGRTPPCVDALIRAGIQRAIIAMQDPNPLVSGQGIDKLKSAGIEVIVGVLEQQAETLNRGFCLRMRSGRPFVRSKIAMSIDGRTAMASGESQWITGPEARQDIQKMRAQSAAILTGIETVLFDDPQLTVRPEGWYPEGQTIRQPLRVVVDSDFKIPADAKILGSEAETCIATLTRASDRGINTITTQAVEGRVDLHQLMKHLAKHEINDVMVEAGPVLNGALLQAGLIDEVVIYMAPKLMGDGARGLFHLPELHAMDQNIGLDITDIRAVGNDWRITALPHYA